MKKEKPSLEELYLRYHHHNEDEAFDAMYDRCYAHCERIVCSQIRKYPIEDYAMSEADVIHEVLMKVLLNHREVKVGLEPMLSRAIKNKLFDIAKRSKAGKKIFHELLRQQQLNEKLSEEPQQLSVQKFIASCPIQPERSREIFIAVTFYNASISDISKKYQLGHSTVYEILRNASKVVRNKLMQRK